VRLAVAAAVAAGALSASAADARVADYSVGEAKFKADANALNVSNFPALPGKGDVDVVLEDAGKLDGKLRILGINCKFWKVENPLSQMVARVLGGWDKDGQLGPATAGPVVRFKAASSLATMRCVEIEELKTRCITRTEINGEATVQRPGSAPVVQPVSVEVEQEQDVGVCGGLARGAAISGRSASIKLAEKLQEIASR
jgi:hypothetical protein